MKKNYIIKGVALSLLFCMNACSLDKDPLSDYSEKTMGSENDTNDRVKYKDRSEMKIQYDAIYQRMKDNQEHWCLDYLLLTEVHADNAYGGTTGLELTTMEDNSVDGANICVARDWERYLTEIAQANKVICNIDAIADALFAQSEREQWKAEAKIYRAMNMFEMARFWGNFPVIISEAGDITADNIEDVYSDYFPAQNTQEEAYQQIEKDLLEAVAYAPDNNPADKTRLSKSVARALLAKVYAEKTLRDYDKVVKYSDEVIADGFTLVNEYEDLFGMNADNTDTKMRSTSESILEVNYFPGGGNWGEII